VIGGQELEVDDDAAHPAVVCAADPDGVGAVAPTGAEGDEVRLGFRSVQFRREGAVAVEAFDQAVELLLAHRPGRVEERRRSGIHTDPVELALAEQSRILTGLQGHLPLAGRGVQKGHPGRGDKRPARRVQQRHRDRELARRHGDGSQRFADPTGIRDGQPPGRDPQRPGVDDLDGGRTVRGVARARSEQPLDAGRAQRPPPLVRRRLVQDHRRGGLVALLGEEPHENLPVAELRFGAEEVLDGSRGPAHLGVPCSGGLGPDLDLPVVRHGRGLLDVPRVGREPPLAGEAPADVLADPQYPRPVALEVDHLRAPGRVIELLNAPHAVRPELDQRQRPVPSGQQHRVVPPGGMPARRDRTRHRFRMGRPLPGTPHLAVRHIKVVEEHELAPPVAADANAFTRHFGPNRTTPPHPNAVPGDAVGTAWTSATALTARVEAPIRAVQRRCGRVRRRARKRLPAPAGSCRT
jgi:hypothetical protein